MEKVVNVSKNELQEIKAIIGEAFITNELFHEFGNIESRRDAVLTYMDAYVQYVYESGLSAFLCLGKDMERRVQKKERRNEEDI